MSWYYYENWQANGHRACLHQADCSHCKDGQGKHVGAGTTNGRWHGPFTSYYSARDQANASGAVVRDCLHCRPHELGPTAAPGSAPTMVSESTGAPMATGPTLRFTLAGREMELSRDDVVRSLCGRTPGTLRTHAVEVAGRLFPVKEAFALATGTDLLDANTNQARRVLQRLGFPVRRVG